MGCNGTVGLSAGRRVAGGGQLLVASGASRRTPTTSGQCGRERPHQNWSLHYMRPQRPVHREGRTQQGAG